jgi:predicted restriction endonuclease
MKKFVSTVMNRSKGVCIVCGTGIEGIVEAAHLSPYATDVKDRANPANGVCLCKFCHRALDPRLIAITLQGDLLVAPDRNRSLAFTSSV